MSDELTSFLTRLAADASLLDRYQRSPHEVIQKAGLSDADQRLVLSGDTERLMAELGFPVPGIVAAAGEPSSGTFAPEADAS